MKVLKDIGERKLIELITKISKSDGSFGSSDDCAVIEFNDSYLLISTDMIAEKTHIPKVMKPWDIGWFITAINLSDLAAKGGKPLGFLLGMGLQKTMPVDDFKQIIQGVSDCTAMYKTDLIGGDTKEHSSNVLSGTIIGIVEKSCFMPRKGAQVDDLVVVTGSLGKAAAGYISYENNMINDELLTGLIHPLPRLSEGFRLGKTEKIHCCMDLSDGLSSSLYQLAKQNNTGFSIEMEKIPSSKHLWLLRDKKDIDFSYQDALLHFGGDYELIFTCSSDDLSFLQTLFPPDILHVIGSVTNTKDIILIENEKECILENKGYEHFLPHFF